MEDKVTYDVFWIDEEHPDEWRIFSEWCENLDNAASEFHLVLKNPRCLGAKIVERVECFKDYVVAIKGVNYV